MWLFIQPNDALFIRDGRSFDAGSDIWAGHIFPPFPPSFHGMLRTLMVHLVSDSIDYGDFFKNVPSKFQQMLGDKSKLGELSIKGPFLGEAYGEKVRLFVPCPADLFYEEIDKGKKRNWYLLQPRKDKVISAFSDMPIPFLALGFADEKKGPYLEPENRPLGDLRLENYLLGKTEHSIVGAVDYDEEDKFWKEEKSTIIERGKNLTAKEHQLAHPAYIRMNSNRGLLLHIDNEDVPIFKDMHIARLGGEGRTCFLKQKEMGAIIDQNELATRIRSTQRFKVLLTSPGYFPENGFFPDFLSAEKGEPPEGKWRFDGDEQRVRLVAMTCMRAVRIGGWNLANGIPKPMIKAVPAGTVYYFEIPAFDEHNDLNWLKQLVSSCLPGTIPGGDTGYDKQGFNTILIGGWDYVS